jgi:hypothetical protein
LVSRELSFAFRELRFGQHETEAMQCVDTAFAHAVSDNHGSAPSRRERLLASGGTPKWSNDAAFAIAQTALRIGTCDRRLISLPEGVFESK